MFKKIISTGVVLASIMLGGNLASANSYDPNSIVDYLISQGKDHSFENRKSLASKVGISNYKGTAEQNTKLLSVLRGKVSVSSVSAPQKEVTRSEGKTISVRATAYTAYCSGCSGTTATGINLRANPNQKVIAVDPNVIPLGSRVYVEGYGEAIAGDVGGAIKGNRIDVFIPSKQEAYNWGVRNVKVTILN